MIERYNREEKEWKDTRWCDFAEILVSYQTRIDCAMWEENSQIYMAIVFDHNIDVYRRPAH